MVELALLDRLALGRRPHLLNDLLLILAMLVGRGELEGR